jgi:hypothetical protein
MCPSTGSLYPVVVFSRHYYERAPAMACDLDRFAAGALLKRVELAAELRDRRRDHGINCNFDSFRKGRYNVGDVTLCERTYGAVRELAILLVSAR